MILGTQIIVLDQVDSTNDYAKTNFLTLQDGAVIMAKVQTDGRGRLCRSWVSKEDGNLYSSFVIKDLSWLEMPTHLPIFCAVVLRRTLASVSNNDDFLLKWPNDLYYDNGKISGILIESDLHGIVVGIGVNILKAPVLSDKKTACLAQILDSKNLPSPQEFLSIFIKLFNKALSQYLQNGASVFIEEWQKYCRHLNKKVAINEGLDDNTPLKEAVFLGLAKDGGARLKVDKELKERVVYYGELKVGE